MPRATPWEHLQLAAGLLLDEPFDGVDPIGVEAALARGACVLLSTHLRELAVQACELAVVLRRGLPVAVGPAAELAGAGGVDAYRELLG